MSKGAEYEMMKFVEVIINNTSRPSIDVRLHTLTNKTVIIRHIAHECYMSFVSAAWHQHVAVAMLVLTNFV
jgi:hypothetical protein